MWQRFYFFQICDKYTIRRTKRKEEEGGAFRMSVWNPWHGCRKYSEGCDHCYMYYLDNERGKSGGEIYKVKTNSDFSVSKTRSCIITYLYLF